ncbi:MAG: exosortase N [Bacteroidota bacterium]
MRNLSPIMALLLLLAFGGIYIAFQQAYLLLDFSFVLGLLLSPFIIRGGQGVGGHRFAGWALAGFLLLFWERNSSLYFFSIGAAMLYVLEQWRGRLNKLSLALLLLLSPIFRQVLNGWSFPIRLWLSEQAAAALGTLGYTASAQGNIIILNGIEHAVDPACAGLKMLSTALLLGLVLLAYRERQRQAYIGFLPLGLSLLLLLLLAVVANFNRLLALVIFHILPGHPMHDGIGLLSLLLYVWLPFYFFTGFWWKAEKERSPEWRGQPLSWRSWGLSGLLLLLAIGGGRQFGQPLQMEDARLAAFRPADFEASLTTNGVLQLKRSDALIYVKPPVKPWQGSHDPRICWRGSGYDFARVEKVRLAGGEVYKGELVKGEERIYSAWWYDDGEAQTVEEWDWRWNSWWRGRSYYLINVNTAEESCLEELVVRMRQLDW